MKKRVNSYNQPSHGYLLLRQAIRDYRNGLITFDDLRSVCVTWAKNETKTCEGKKETADTIPSTNGTTRST
jgi:hypothetical protein